MKNTHEDMGILSAASSIQQRCMKAGPTPKASFCRKYDKRAISTKLKGEDQLHGQISGSPPTKEWK